MLHQIQLEDPSIDYCAIESKFLQELLIFYSMLYNALKQVTCNVDFFYVTTGIVSQQQNTIMICELTYLKAMVYL